MNEYRSVNYYELCRLCAATQGTKLNLFSEDARKQELVSKIAECLPVKVDDKDKLPKTICELCVQQLHQISEYRQKCANTQAMLESCLGTNKLKNEGRVYIKDESAKAGAGGSRPATNIVTLKNSSVKPTLVPIVSQAQQQQQQQQHTQQQQIQQLDPLSIPAGSDYLSNIVQSVGIKMDDGTEVLNSPQYTFTIKEIPQQSINDQQRLQTYSQMDEFLKPKTEAKPQYNLVLNHQNQIATSMASGTPQMKQVINANTPFVLTTNQALNQVTANQQQQQQQAQLPKYQVVQAAAQPKQQQQQQQQCLIMKDNSNQVIQLKLQPQMSTVDGQTYYHLTPATPSQNQTFQTVTTTMQQDNMMKNEIILPRQQTTGKVIHTGGGTPIQLTTLTNATASSTKPSPTMITIQDTPGRGQTATQITPVGRIASTTITRKTPLVLKQESGGVGGQVKYITASSISGTNSIQSGPIFVQSTSTSNGGAQPKELAKTQPRTIFVGGKTMKVVSMQSGGKTMTVTPHNNNKAVPIQTATVVSASATAEDGDSFDMIHVVPTGPKPTCDVCQKEFKRKEHLAQHMKLHEGVRPFKCDICDKAFNRKEHLLRHKTSHTGAKSFKCDHCQKMFSRKDNLNKHKRKHTGEGGDDLDDSGKKYKIEEIEDAV